MSRPGVDALLAKLERRDHLAPAEVAAVETLIEGDHRVAAGQALVEAGDRPDHSTLLLEGLCARYSLLSDGSRVLTQISVPGDFVDLHSLLMEQMDHGVLALTDCHVGAAPHDKLRQVTETHPHLTRMLWLETVIDGAIHRQWLVGLAAQSALGRLAHLLCELQTRLQAAGLADPDGFEFPITQSQLAEMMGVTPVHANRTVGELRRRELVSWAGRRLQIHDFERLARLGEFDPTYLRLTRAPV